MSFFRCLLAMGLMAGGLPGMVNPAAAAQEHPFSSRAWETDDGLPHNGINTVLRRDDGFLWIATQGGLVRFDGVEFVQRRSALLSDAKSSRVVDLIDENPHALLLACDTSGLVRLENGRFSLHPMAGSIGSGRKILSLFREGVDVFWVLCVDRGLWRWDHGRIRHFPPSETVLTTSPFSLARTRDGTVFISRGDGLESFRNDVLSTVPSVAERSLVIAAARDGGLWLASSDRLSRLEGEEVVPVDTTVPWAGTPPMVMLEDHEHALWIGSKFRGLFRREGGGTRLMPTSHARITSLHEDEDGNLWVGTSGGGLNQLQHARFQLLGEKEGWLSDVIGSVCEDRSGRIWFGNNHLGLREVSEGRILEAPVVEGWPKKITSIYPDPSGALWVASSNRLGRCEPDSGQPVVWIGTPPLGGIHAMLVGHDGRLWVGGENGLLLCLGEGMSQRIYGAEDGFTASQIRVLSEDPAGTLWVGTEEGDLFSARDQRFVRHSTAEGLPGSSIRCLTGDADGTLWIGTGGGGLAIGRNGRFTSIREEQGLPDDVISQMLDDGAGTMWFGASRALYKVRKSELLDCAAGRIARVHPVRFGEGDDLAGFSAAANYQPAAWRTRDGHLMFVSRKGLVMAEPAQQPREARALQVHLDKLVVDGASLPLVSLQVPSASRKIEFQFTAPTFTSPEKLRFRYRLHGLDNDWSEPTANRSVSYSPLKPGRYRFEVGVCDSNLTWSPLVGSLPIVIVPAWWETWWARSLAVVAVCSLLAFAVRYWSHQRLKAKLVQYEAARRLENERARIARDLHDGLGAGLTQVGMMAEELAEDCTGVSEMKAYSAKLAGKVRSIARDLDAAVWTVSPKNDTLAALCAYICQYAIEYFRETAVRCHVHIAPDIPDLQLSPDVRHHLFLIAKEVMNNVLKHAGASQVVLSMDMEGDRFALAFEDNGHGFPATVEGACDRHGLQNIRDRSAEVGGQVDLRSSPVGTVVRILLPAFPPSKSRLSSQ